MTIRSKISARDAIREITGPISFGQILHAYRIGYEYSQVEMAALLSISKQDLCNIEKGRKFVSVGRAVSFARALDMPEKTFARYAIQDQLTRAGINWEVNFRDVA